MSTFFKILAFAAVLAVAGAGPIRAQDNAQDSQDTASNGVSFQMFYDQLSQYGTWINTSQYGNVFQPTETDPNWAPYTYGNWVNTDQGMTWNSTEPFGWATYHYGRWVNLDGTGWVWVPGYTWAPAWVSWRQDATDVGWAPLPPDSDQGIDYYGDDDYYDDADYYGYHIGDDCDLVYGIGPWWYNFCPIAFIGDRDCWRHFHDRRDNFGFIHNTRNVTNINFRRDGAGRFGHVRAEGPNVAALNAQAHTPIRTASLASATRMNETGLHGNTLSVFAPRISTTSAGTVRPNVISRSLASTTVNRGTNINDPTAVNSHLAPAAATSAQVQAAALASSTANGNARVATTHTQLSRPLTQPISSLHTGLRTNSAATQNSFRATTPAAVSGESRFTGEGTTQRAAVAPSGFRSYSSANEVSHSAVTFPHRTTQTYSLGEPAFRESAPASQSFRSYSAPEYHYSTPSYSAPAYHYSAPAQHFSAPAEHFSSGFSGGGFRSSSISGGGGGFHGGGGFSGGGGGHAGGGGGHR